MKPVKTVTTTSVHGEDFAGRVVVVRETFADPLRLFHCAGGFGCDPTKMGRAVFGHWLSDGTGDRINRSDAVAFATPEQVSEGEKYAKGPATHRLKVQMREYHRAAERAIRAVANAPSRGRGRLSREEILDKFLTLQREYSRLHHMFCNTSMEKDAGWNDDGTAKGTTYLDYYAEKFAEEWDAANRRRQ